MKTNIGTEPENSAKYPTKIVIKTVQNSKRSCRFSKRRWISSLFQRWNRRSFVNEIWKMAADFCKNRNGRRRGARRRGRGAARGRSPKSGDSAFCEDNYRIRSTKHFKIYRLLTSACFDRFHAGKLGKRKSSENVRDFRMGKLIFLEWIVTEWESMLRKYTILRDVDGLIFHEYICGKRMKLID